MPSPSFFLYFTGSGFSNQLAGLPVVPGSLQDMPDPLRRPEITIL